ncbi:MULTISPECIES: type II toxin-antitoxin system ParD family antitoxin [Marisediminitalea]|jgi:antitoxin ParD1/3/4|nr:type II toxin-antitoxin system ParD family antitoxin [Marisediminitalea aggregata]MAP19488.1 type II toxin-antitoxin system ParD family antitoxin [Alteromonadaceae bacterium]MCP3863286.1 type II toxin-antitoxin system ParD family antitoxin [Aestuariibacter sp.]MCP4275254.1 type II toxin-antitoxin system ParD family antitoxin [Gammaproteobacteria bacterium]HBY39238.1 type II toxin-antitoxin system ParD family antitoxin [Alteromonas sp.]MAX45083.1 type II toxin-antitoxin system ParD family an|tara:strand:- start:3025 stop:3249 length:225 start_codon:yes stop_codon:yes gene_type:complete
MATLNVSLPDEMRTWIDEQVKTGKYANASDYIRDLVRRNQSERDAINLALIEGELSGSSTKNVMDILKEKRSRA